jgi:threonine aldolase
VGSKEFINRARKNRKLMGGGMRQVGYIAAACLVALNKMTNRLIEDHKNAKYMAKILDETGIFNVFKDRLDINMVFFKINNKLAKSFDEKEFISYLSKYNIKISQSENGEFRFVTHYWITKKRIDYLMDIINKYLRRK